VSGFQKWKDGVDRADSRWDSHDATIKDVVTRYNMHLTRTPGYWSLDWRMVKAMVWTETGPHNSDWNARPMRMGVPGDAGLPALRSGREGSDLIVPPGMIIGSRATIDPRENIRAGVGYLLMRMANFDMVTVMSSDKSVFDVTVGSTEKSWEAVAKRCGTTAPRTTSC